MAREEKKMRLKIKEGNQGHDMSWIQGRREFQEGALYNSQWCARARGANGKQAIF